VLAAWVAYLLCFRLTRVRAAALVGGFVFGFSSYEMAQDTAALNLCFTVCVPALLLLVLARLDDAIGRGWAVWLAAILLILQFLISIEIFAMIFIFGGIAWGFALLLLPQRRAALRRLVVDGLVAAPFVALVLAPFLISMLRHFNAINHPVFWPYYFDADLVNLAVPTPLNAFGCLFTGISKHFNIGTQEQDAYIGLPLLVMVWMFARESDRQPRGHFLVLLWLVFLLLSFGPRLWVAGHYSPIVLPWMLVVNLPLLGAALPGRFALFVSLMSAVIAAYWIAAPGAPRWRLALGVLACVSLAPSLHPWRAMPTSAFFAPGRVQAVLGPNPRILILPFAINGPSSFWQQENQFGFTQTGGYLGFPPAAMQKYKAVGELFGNYEKPGFAGDFALFCTQTATQYVVAGPGVSAPLQQTLRGLNWRHFQVDDVTVYAVPGSVRG
jgi:hypothetical protein